MNAYTTRGQARIEHRDIAALLQPEGILAAAQLASLEWQRGYQTDVEVEAAKAERRRAEGEHRSSRCSGRRWVRC